MALLFALSAFDGSLPPALAAALFASVGMLALVAAWRAPRLLADWRARSLTPALSRRLSRWVKSLDYTGDDFFRADGAGPEWVQRRKLAFEELRAVLEQRSKQARSWSEGVREGLSDLRFADANRVPFPFARRMREDFDLCTVVTASEGPRLLDLDGHWTLDVGGSYGVNVVGYDQYKEWTEA